MRAYARVRVEARRVSTEGMRIVSTEVSPGDRLTLYRPVGPAEWALIVAADYRAFPPRLPEQPIFYPVLNEAYATQIARDWNVRDSGAGFVTRFQIDADFARRYPVQTVG